MFYYKNIFVFIYFLKYKKKVLYHLHERESCSFGSLENIKMSKHVKINQHIVKLIVDAKSLDT